MIGVNHTSIYSVFFMCLCNLNATLHKNLHLETNNSVSNPSRNRIPNILETEFSVLKTLVCDFDHL